MWRGILSVIALMLVCGSSVVITSIWVLPNTFLYRFIPVLQPLHQAMACEAGETMEYEYVFVLDSQEVQYRCVSAAGLVRDVDGIVERPALYALATLSLGVLLLVNPFRIAMRQAFSGESGAALATMLQQHSQETQPQQDVTSANKRSALTATGQQQLDALEKLRQQKLITQEAYEAAQKQIFDNFRSS